MAKIRLLQNDFKNEGNINSSKEQFERFVYEWNITNPIDRYYRKKYNIRFNSPEHRVCNFIDMAFEYLEDKIFEFKEKEEYIPGTKDYLKKKKEIEEEISDEQMMSLFDSDKVKDLDDGR
jgi:hypothetical protein